MIRGFLGEESTIPGNLFSYLHGSISTNYATSDYNDDIKANLGLRDVTSACDDDAKGDMGSRDVISAYDDDSKCNMGFRDVTSVYDDDARAVISSEFMMMTLRTIWVLGM